MPVTEQVQALGSWSIEFERSAPKAVREACWHPHSSIIVTRAHIPSTTQEGQLLVDARYHGVIMDRTPYGLSGPGLAWWIGDADGQGAVTTAALTFGGATYATIYTSLITAALDLGARPSGGSVSRTYPRGVDYRSLLDSVTSHYGHEWQVTPDMFVNVGTVVDLYGAPTVILSPTGGRGGALVTVAAKITPRVDWAQHAHKVYVQGRDATGISPTEASYYLAPNGTAHTRVMKLDLQEVAPGLETVYAENLANEFSDQRGREGVDVEVLEPGIEGLVTCGDQVYVYDQVAGVEDLSNPVLHAGANSWPVLMRCVRMSWPIRAGMGVYHRVWWDGAAAPTYTDLTPYIKFEDPSPGTLELISRGDVNRFSAQNSTARADLVSMQADRYASNAWDTYSPSWTSSATQPTLGNGTITGGYRAVGTTLHLRGELIVGSTSTVGTGHLRVSLPSGVTAVAAQAQSCSARWYDASAGFVYSATGIAEAGLGYITFVVAGRSEDRFPSSALGNGDYVTWGGTIERTGP